MMASCFNRLSQTIEREESSIRVVLGLHFKKLRIKYPSRSSERRWVTKCQELLITVTKW